MPNFLAKYVYSPQYSGRPINLYICDTKQQKDSEDGKETLSGEDGRETLSGEDRKGTVSGEKGKETQR